MTMVSGWLHLPAAKVLAVVCVLGISSRRLHVVAGGINETTPYAGEWDLAASRVARLCYMVENGVSHDQVPMSVPKDEYLRDGVCWKYRWNPCEYPEEEPDMGPEKRRPCGYYEMVEAPSDECD